MNSIPEAAEQLCWTSLRSIMAAYGEHKLRELIALHSDETYYCLGVYFDGCYGDFFLYLNDPATAREEAETRKRSASGSDARKTVEEIEDKTKWYLDHFRYQKFNVDPLWQKLWYPVQTLIDQLASELLENDEAEELHIKWSATFAETVCLVALDLEQSEAVRALKKTEDFRVICIDHDETMGDSKARLERVRKTYAPLPSP
jgi:hypothetical protein